MGAKKESDESFIPTLDWKPATAARIEPNPPRPRSFAESTMSDEDYAAAQEDAKAGRIRSGKLKDWGSMPEFQKE